VIDLTKTIELKSPAELEKMRAAGILLRRVIDEVERRVEPGVTTAQLDTIARRMIQSAGATPAFLGYHGFPATLCTSVNEEVVHGIPSSRRLEEGDIVSIDCGLVLDGFYSDTATTVAVGAISDEAQRLLDATRESLEVGIRELITGNRIGSLSAAIQDAIERCGFSVVREYTGHGIGRSMHEPPQVPNFGKADTGVRLKSGMVLAIEPMVNAGTWKTRTLSDGWTVVTADGSLSAHFEHTIAVTDSGPYVLTARIT
jgi:methionyl aminopeptidase